MIAVLGTDELFLTVGSESALSSHGYQLQDRAGAVVATVHDLAGGGQRFARAVLGSGRSKYAWELRDADGNRVLQIVKPKTGLRGAKPEVSLADGRPLGRVVPAGFSGAFARGSMQRPDGAEVGELVPAVGERRAYPILMYRITAGGAETGEIARQVDGQWAWCVKFAPGTDVLVRALSIAWTLCLSHQRSTPTSN